MLKSWKRRRTLARSAIAGDDWRAALELLPLLDGLDADELARLRALAVLFLAEKAVTGAAGLEVTDRMRVVIALQACLPILNLGLDAYAGFSDIVVYPGRFVPHHAITDEAGVVHEDRAVHLGEAWDVGPLVLSWEDARDGGAEDGVNVVIHEFAHKLDMANGDANGFPPLHRGMDRDAWAGAWAAAFGDFCARVDAGEDTAIDPYAAESPAEFFAVVSEVFFEWPEVVADEYPAVYAQLRAYYRQDPLARAARPDPASPDPAGPAP